MPSSMFGLPRPRVSLPDEFASEDKLLAFLGVSKPELKKIWWFREKMYHEFSIAKGAGKVRTIFAPDDRLKFLQRKLVSLLTPLYRVRHPVHGFVTGKSVKSNAEAHFRKRFVLNLDLKDFFPSITENRIIGVLQSLGIDDRVAEIVARISCSMGQLPQGAPTSPILSNMICFRLDRELLTFAKSARCIFTRYADDITFSSNQPMAAVFKDGPPSAGRLDCDRLADELTGIVALNGFLINPNKAHYADKHSRRMVTGIKVNELLNLDRRYVRNIRAALFSVETLGPNEAQLKFQNSHGGSGSLANHLQGKLSWLGYIRGQSDPVFRALAMRFNQCFPNEQINLEATPTEMRDRSVWVIESLKNEKSDKQGSAFFLQGIGLVTAAHCVEGLDQVSLFHPGKPSNVFKADIQKMDQHRDVAVLGHNVPNTEFYELERAANEIAIGNETIAVGYPGFALGDNLNVREGKVSSLTIKSGVRLIEVQQKLAQGMSGGPLLNQSNEVVGIIHKGGPNEGRDFATHLDALTDMLSE